MSPFYRLGNETKMANSHPQLDCFEEASELMMCSGVFPDMIGHRALTSEWFNPLIDLAHD